MAGFDTYEAGLKELSLPGDRFLAVRCDLTSGSGNHTYCMANAGVAIITADGGWTVRAK